MWSSVQIHHFANFHCFPPHARYFFPLFWCFLYMSMNPYFLLSLFCTCNLNTGPRLQRLIGNVTVIMAHGSKCHAIWMKTQMSLYWHCLFVATSMRTCKIGRAHV